MATADQHGQAQHFVMCENCEGPVEFTCIRCDLKFCGDCSLTHMRTKSKRGHEVREYSSHVTQHCALHPRSICEFYCKSCTAPLCTECVSTNAHKLHDLSSMSATVTFFHTLMSEEYRELQTKVKGNLKKRIEDLESSITKVAQQCVIARHDVAQWRAKMHREIDILVESLRQEIKTAEEEAARILIEQKGMMESKIKDLEDALKKSKDILESENSKQIVKFQSKIDQLSELPSLRTIYLPEFVPSAAEIKSNVKRLFGDVKLSAYHASKNFTNPTQSRTSNEIYSDVIQQHGDVFSAQDVSRKQLSSSGVQDDRDMLKKQFSSIRAQEPSFFGAHKDRDVSKKQSSSFGTQEDRDTLKKQLSCIGAKENCDLSGNLFLECKVHPKLILCLQKVRHFREKVEKFLRDLNVRPLWSKSKSNGDKAFLILERTNVTADLDETWKKYVRHTLQEFLNEWEVNSFNVSEHLWDRMLEMLKTVCIPNPENIVCHIDRKERQIYVIGKASDAMKLTMAIQKALWDMDDKH